MIDGAGNPGSDLGQEQKNMAGLKQLMGSPPLLIIGFLTAIHM
jgi:hypothetical protein